MISHGAARIFSAAIIAPALGLLLLSSAPVMAQQAVPEIPFESIPDPLKLPVPPLSAEDGRFRQPTYVTFDPEGDIFISDGYINSRVAKADKNGNWIKSWGNRGNKPGEFNTPHNIAADAKGNIYVADRGNRRIQVFDSEGNFLRIMTIDVPFDANARPAIGNKPDLQTCL